MQIFIIDRPQLDPVSFAPFLRQAGILRLRSSQSPLTIKIATTHAVPCAGQVDGKLISIFDAVKKIYLWPGGCLAGWTLKLSDFPRRKNSNGLIASRVLCFPVRAQRIKKNQLGTKSSSADMLYSPTSNIIIAITQTLRHHNWTHDYFSELIKATQRMKFK